MTSFLILSSLVYPLTLLKKRISAASRRVMSQVFIFFTFAKLFTIFTCSNIHSRVVTRRKTEFFAGIQICYQRSKYTLRADTDKPWHSATVVVRRRLWRYIEGGGKLKYCIVGNFCLHTFIGVKWGWRYIGVWLCGPSTRLNTVVTWRKVRRMSISALVGTALTCDRLYDWLPGAESFLRC
jgi:hypothetical protein